MVDDVGREDAHADVVGEFPGFARDRDVERQDARVLGRFLLQHDARPHHVPLVHGPDVDAGHRDVDAVGLQKLEKGFQRPERRRLRAHALARAVDRGKDIVHVFHGLQFEAVQVVAGALDEELSARDGGLQAVRANLDPLRRPHRLVVLVRPLDAQLFEGVRREQRAHGGDEGAVQAARDDGVALGEGAVDEDDVHGGAQALDDL